jgi:hypothetical protein
MLENQILSAMRGTWLTDSEAELIEVTASQTLAELGLTITDDVQAVTVIVPPGGTVNYNPVGEADAANAALPSTYTVYRNGVLDTAEFFAASSTDVSFIVHKLASDIDGLGA